MRKRQSTRNIVYRATLLGLLAILAACGGGDKKEEPPPCTSNIIVLIICSILSTDGPVPNEGPVSANDSSAAGKSSAAAGVNGESPEIVQVDEFEPNNVLDNANIVTFPGSIAEVSTGVEYKGSVQSTDDAADFLIFTPNRSGSHRIYLCADTCAESLEDDAAYIMIYDQYQTTITGTPVGTITRQEITADLTAGFAYYVEVNGYNAGAESYVYRLMVID